MPGGSCAGTGLGIVSSQQVQQICALEFHDIIGLALFINEQREGDARFFTKSAGVDTIAKPHGGQSCAALPEGLLVGAQLRDVLAAEDSAIMAQEDNHRGLAEP
jgi:hypothetical protein